ncbi:MAG: hypothetical protein Q8P20_01635 [bacterium]|nr:hypothetical protein [bacterium]
MNTKIQKFIRGSVGGAFDAVISSFPGVNIAWGAIKGGVAKVREKKAEEFILFLQNNTEIIDFNNEQFVDGLGLTFEQYLRQRDEQKRKIIQQIFLGFSNSKYMRNFELERMYDVLNKISFSHVHLLEKLKKNKFIRIDADQREIVEFDYDDIKYLEYLGLVNSDNKKEVEVETDQEEYDVDFREHDIFRLSVFGEDFIEFVKT